MALCAAIGAAGLTATAAPAHADAVVQISGPTSPVNAGNSYAYAVTIQGAPHQIGISLTVDITGPAIIMGISSADCTRSAAATSATCQDAGSATVTYTFFMGPTQAGQVTAVATASGDASGTDSTTTTINPRPLPTVTSITPNSGPASGGTQITITGTNLQYTQEIAVGPEPATNVSCSATTCTALTPPWSPGAVQVRVFTDYGSTNDPGDIYTYTPSPTIVESERMEGFSTVTTDHLLSMTGPGPYLLVAFVSSDGPGASQSATVSGGGLTWTLAGRANAVGGTAEVWTAYTTTSPENDTITSTALWPGYAQMLLVDVFSGASGVGAVATGGQHSGQIGATLTTTAANSWVYAVGEDYSQATTITPGYAQGVAYQYKDTVNGDTFWVQNQNQPTPAAGTQVTMNDAAPPLYDTWNFAAVEILSSGS